MNGLELHERMKPVVAWLEKQPRHTLASLLTQRAIMTRLFAPGLREDEHEHAFNQELALLRSEVKEMRGISRLVLANRRSKRLSDRLDAGLPLGRPRRRRRRRKL